jgi:hypothetical protein
VKHQVQCLVLLSVPFLLPNGGSSGIALCTYLNSEASLLILSY